MFESTVYPGLTNNFCIPILEKETKFREGKDFFVGYSPERINPGDKKHTLKMINKILAYPHSFKKKEIIKLYSNLGKKIIFTKNIKPFNQNDLKWLIGDLKDSFIKNIFRNALNGLY